MVQPAINKPGWKDPDIDGSHEKARRGTSHLFPPEVVQAEVERSMFGKTTEVFPEEDDWGLWHHPGTWKFVTKPEWGVRYGQEVASRID